MKLTRKQELKLIDLGLSLHLDRTLFPTTTRTATRMRRRRP